MGTCAVLLLTELAFVANDGQLEDFVDCTQVGWYANRARRSAASCAMLRVPVGCRTCARELDHELHVLLLLQGAARLLVLAIILGTPQRRNENV